MENNIIPDDFEQYSPQQRMEFLRANADEVKKDQNEVIPLNPDKKDETKEEYVLTNMELAAEQEKYDKVKAEWKEKLDPLKKKSKELLSLVRTGYQEITTDVYLFRDHDLGRVLKVLPTGEIIDSRRMLDHEKQQTVAGNIRSLNSK